MTDAVLLSLLVFIPLATGLAVALAWRRPRLHAPLNLAGMTALVVLGGVLVGRVAGGAVLATSIGGWPAPFGIPLVADALSAVMVLVTGVVGLAIGLHALVEQEPGPPGLVHALTPLLVGAACGAYLTGDLFNLYVWFEVMLITSFVLMALGAGPAQLRGTVQYLASNLLASTLLLAAIGLLYGLAGTLNLAELTQLAPRLDPARLTVVASLFLVAVGTKAAVFPLFFWLPSSYSAPSVTTTALFAGLLTKVAVYALLRAFTFVFVTDPGFTQTLLLWVAGLTMVTGVLGAVAQDDLRRLLSFHIVSQIGYMIMGLALLTPLALLGAMYFLLHNILAKTALFLVGAAMSRLRGGTLSLGRLGGLLDAQPLLAGLFLVPALALAGVPPLSGFWGKLLLVRAGLEAQRPEIVAVSLVVSLLTLFSMLKIWSMAFLAPPPEGTPAPDAGPMPAAQLGAIVVLVAGTLAMSLLAGPTCELLQRAAEGLLAPRAYVEAVLGA